MARKGGKRRLRAVPARVFVDHRCPDAVEHRRIYAALHEELSLTTTLLRYEGSRVALLGVIARNAGRALMAHQAQARDGKGRGGPSPRDLERLLRRQGLADGSFSQALDKLRELASRKRPLDLAQRIAAAQQGQAR